MFLVGLVRHHVTKALSGSTSSRPVPLNPVHLPAIDRLAYGLAGFQSSDRGSGKVVATITPAALEELVPKLILKNKTKATDLKVVRRGSLLGRVGVLVYGAPLIRPHSWKMRVQYFCDKTQGMLSLDLPTQAELGVQGAMQGSGMADPSNMMNMVKQNMAMMVPQMVLMAWVSYFFSGFIVLKLPFEWLTPAFRPMLQRGLESLTSLDVSYVSSLSWYFLVVFGMRSLTTLALGEASRADDAEIMRQQMAMQTGGMAGQSPDIGKLYKDSRDNMELVQHEWSLEGAEGRILREYEQH